MLNVSCKLNFAFVLYLSLPRHSPLEKSSSHRSHTESSVFKQPPPLEPSMSSPPPSLRDPPWPHGVTPPSRPSPSDRAPTQSQRKDSSLSSAVPGHRIPRPYNKVASSEYRWCTYGKCKRLKKLQLSLVCLAQFVITLFLKMLDVSCFQFFRQANDTYPVFFSHFMLADHQTNLTSIHLSLKHLEFTLHLPASSCFSSCLLKVGCFWSFSPSPKHTLPVFDQLFIVILIY